MKTTDASPPSLYELIDQKIDCEDLAIRLSLPRPGDKGKFFNPRRKTATPCIRCYARTAESLSRFEDEDHTDDEGRCIGGGPLELAMYVLDLKAIDALMKIVELYGELLGPVSPDAAQPEPTRMDFAAQRSQDTMLNGEQRLILQGWLADRGITERTSMAAIEAGTLGMNDYTSPRLAKGEMHYGGEALAAIVRSPDDGAVLAVDLEYLHPEDNGGLSTAKYGGHVGALWCSDWKRFAKAHKVVVVLSPLDALSIDVCNLPSTVAVAIRSTWTAHQVDWRLMRGKQVVICICPGKPIESGSGKGYCPGQQAAWAVHEALIGLDIAALMVDQDEWLDDDEQPMASVNAYLQDAGAEKLAGSVRRLEPWLIPGMPGKDQQGKPRLYLPFHDQQTYWRYRVKEDFTSWISKFENDEDNPEQKNILSMENVCGFRVAGLSRVTIASPTSTMTGDVDTSPRTIFALSVQVPRHGSKLLRRVVTDEQLHNIEVWKRLGPVFSAPNFGRMLNIMERAADIGARDAVNFVGLAWRNGQAVVNQGPDCYFNDPAQQCPYADLVFPSGPAANARKVIDAYQSTFGGNSAAQMLVWSLGAHLKAFLGFWPHFVMQADKGVGKDTVIKRLERSIGMTVFSRQTMQTEFRIMTSVSYTSHPVGWGELSANKQDLITKAVANLQECYQYSHTRRGSDLKDFLLCAPVLLAGEDVPVDTLAGKVVRNMMTKAQRGKLMPEDLPVFPVRQWMEYLCTIPKARVQELHTRCMAELRRSCSAADDDAGAARMLTNYGAVRAAWTLLCDFAGIDVSQGDFLGDLTRQMNLHIADTEGDRHPWVWIVKSLLSEIARGNFRYPFVFKKVEGVEVLAVRTAHVMDHLAREPSLRAFWDDLPVKSDRVFKRALANAGVVFVEQMECTHAGKRVGHMVGLSLEAMEQYGLHATPPVEHPEPVI
ncbi:toprim domain-containing protein [Paucibacter sp. Y2R2-4]|uniref:toprim domain-containing protein n=1 Tax=Paucibacter sp. Y2R2-4 TaxID=2893553 RepID=UPI0021E419BC|nr:toprim domain-containing protein [Paucibacter sp. Y2R2-4]MCV2349317.1 toprim domain-containing protein [Paucibacter sp. Y2R2-4]